MSIPRFAIQRPVMMMMLSSIVILLGGISLSRLPVDLLPDISQPSVNVRVTYLGVGPLEMEELITRPLEQQLSAVQGLEQMNSASQEGSTQISLNFVWGTDLNEAMNDIRTRIDRVRNRLPEDADPPVVQKFDANAAPIMGLAVESTDGALDRVSLRELSENVLSPRLERVPGVAAVTVGGGLRRQIHVELSREKTTALDLSVDRVVNLLRTENQNIPIGEVYQGDRSLLLRSQGQFQNLDQIRNLVVLTKTGVPVYVKDIAEVVDSTEDNRSILRINGRPGVRLQVTKQSGTNTVQIAEGVRAEIARINQEVPGVKISLLDDSAKFIERSISAVQEHVMIGSVLVVLIIFLFLRNFRSTLIVCTAIPISVVGTFALLYFGGLTLNTMTFGGLALGVGMIVDAAIVVLENSFRHMEHHGKDRMTASIDGSEEVWSAILASILTHIAVFVPLLFLEGVSSILFRQLSIVVCFSLAMSLFVAVTLVPVLCSRLLVLPPPPDQRRGIGGQLFTISERALEGIDNGYRRLLHTALNHRWIVVSLSAASVVAAAIILPTLPTEFATQTDEGQVQVNAELAQGTRIEVTDPVLQRLERMVGELVPEATDVIVNAGGGGPGFGGPGGSGAVNRGSLQLLLKPKDERTRSSDEIAQDLRRQLSGIPGVIVRANASGGNQQMNRFLSGGNNGGGRLSLEIRGESLDDARKISQATKELLDTVPGVADARLGRDDGRPELAVQIDRAKAALLGVSATALANTIRTNIAGEQAALFRQGGQEYPIIVRLREDQRQAVGDVSDVLVSTPTGQVLQAKNLMRVEDAVGPSQIQRKNQQRIAYVSAEPETTLSEAVDSVRSRLPQIYGLLPKDFSIGFGAEVEQQAKAFNQLRMVLILALVLVYAVMASQYESLRDPFIIMFSVPTAAIGVVLALKLTGTSFNMQAYIGIIMLAGIVVSNGILLVDYTNVLRRRDGMELREAVELAGRTRLRPILMTSIATGLGLVPMSLGIGEGSELQVPLARVVIGGLTTSLLITLVLVPTVYTLFEEGLGSIFRRSKKAEAVKGIESMKKAIVTLLVVGVIGASAYAYYHYKESAPKFTVSTAQVTRGDVVDTVGATGTLQAVTTVQVGTQVSGTISELHADFNSLVKKGQVLARLDPSLFATQIEQAKANLVRSQADLERQKVALDDANTKLQRAKELSDRQLLPRSELDAADVAQRAAEAQLKSSDAQITQAQASLNQNQVNLEHTVIEAPIDGLVISRNVDVGQTVAASMQAPTLFVLAADLTKMQVVANLDESDVGRIRPGQVVTFRVDAYPNEAFRGLVSQVRLNPIVQQNVVTYATVIDVPNTDLKLKPGMTANVNVEINRSSDVLRVPNSALRFRPTNEMFAAIGQPVPDPGQLRDGGGRRGGGQNAGTGNQQPASPAGAAAAATSATGSQPNPAAPGPPARGAGNSKGTPATDATSSGEGSGGWNGGGRGSGRGDLTPEEREQRLQRLRDRGGDPNATGPQGGRGGAPGQANKTAAAGGRGATPPVTPKTAVAGREAGATTIDALFGPLPHVESSGRAWLYADKQLKPVRLRLGISDGQNTELIEGDLQQGQDLVTNIALGNDTRPPAANFSPFGQPGRGGFGPGGGNRGGGAGGGRGGGR